MLFAVFTLVVVTGTATAAPTTAGVAPPGPVRDLTIGDRGGQGARTAYIAVRWTPPADSGGGIRTHYVYDVRNVVDTRLGSGATGATSVGDFSADRCTTPYTVTVRAVTQDPDTGAPIAGPESTATFGTLRCEINSSLTATQTGPGTLQVDINREAPVDPEVAGDCVLRDNGVVAWTGVCGGATGEQAVLTDRARGVHRLVLTTTSPNGQDYVTRTRVRVA